MITVAHYKLDPANLPDKKLTYEVAKDNYFDEIALGNRSTRDNSLIRFFKSAAIMAPEISTIFLPEDPIKICDMFD